MIVKFLKETAHVDGPFAKGAVADVSFANGQTWIETRHAAKASQEDLEKFQEEGKSARASKK
ncbi:hypothetical protein AAG747_15420 [Rapidithrix thailandica]|uniref:Uncharacterized protein n=1 Tax=Rapidithrix thailandica TaxID=413964 RepID=A0AAW9SA24_9BACT